MTTARDVTVVINQLLNIIPMEERDIRNRLTVYHDSLWNQAPEARRTYDCWQPLMIILNELIPNIDTEWKRNMLNIINQT
jgi:hypothetical protein